MSPLRRYHSSELSNSESIPNAFFQCLHLITKLIEIARYARSKKSDIFHSILFPFRVSDDIAHSPHLFLGINCL